MRQKLITENTLEETIICSCDRCGKEDKFNKQSKESWLDFKENEWHNIKIPTSGYGSILDGCKIEFDLCDQCLFEIVKSLSERTQNRIFENY
jgi:hypothetical protein